MCVCVQILNYSYNHTHLGLQLRRSLRSHQCCGMNGDESSYAVLFPLPFRVLSLTGLGILGWATNIHGLEALGVDATTILGLRSVDGTHSPLPSTRAEIGYRDSNEGRRIYHSVYRIAALYTIWCLLFWLSFRFLTSGNMLAIDSFRWVPAICIIGLVLILFSPFETLFRQERELFLRYECRSATYFS